MKQMFECKVASTFDNGFSVVLNKGKNAGLKEGLKFLVYKKGDEIFDPDTNESLGTLEIVCGHGVVTHVQDKYATVKCTDKQVKTVKICRAGWQKSIALAAGWPESEEKTIELPFKNVEIGNFARCQE